MENLTLTNSTYMNAYLQKATDKIRQYDLNIRANQFAIAHIMGRVESEGLYADDGFTSATEWAQDAFGIKKTTAYNLITLGRDYVREVRDSKGKLKGYASNIVDSDEGTMPLLDYSTNQLARLSTLGHDEVKRFHDEGILKPSMTAKEIQDFIKVQKALKAPEPEQTEPEQPSAPESEQPEQNDQPDTTEPEPIVKRLGARDPGWDNANTEQLIAELYARGFAVIKGGVAYDIRWGE